MATVYGGTSIKFNSNELQSAKVIIESIQPFGGLQKELNYIKLSRANKSRKTNQVYPSRVIPCMGHINGSSLADLKTQIDTFQTLLESSSSLYGTLDIDIDQQGNYRRWTADPQQMDINMGSSPLSVNFSFNFVCPDPFGRDLTATTIINNASLTTSGASNAITVGGTAPQQQPIVTLTLNSFGASSSNTVTITNPATSQAISVTRVWAAADVLVLDMSTNTIKVNGTAVDYTGPLVAMNWAYGSGSIVISDDFTARNMTLLMTNVNRYK